MSGASAARGMDSFLLRTRAEEAMLGKGPAVLAIGTALLLTSQADGEPVPVRHAEGVVRGFLTLRELDGTRLADGDLIQTSRGQRVTTRLVFKFKDGSIHDETAEFSQREQFQLVSDHLVQKGPSFPQPIDVAIDATTDTCAARCSTSLGTICPVGR